MAFSYRWPKVFTIRGKKADLVRNQVYIILAWNWNGTPKIEHTSSWVVDSNGHTMLKSYKQKRIEAVDSVKSGCHFSHVVMSVIIRKILYYSVFPASTLTETNTRKVLISSIILYMNYTLAKERI